MAAALAGYFHLPILKLTPESGPPFFFLPPSRDSMDSRFSSSIDTLLAASHAACRQGRDDYYY